MSLPRWHAVELGAAQRHEVSALFAQVFGLPMSDALWRWKYDAGRGVDFLTLPDALVPAKS